MSAALDRITVTCDSAFHEGRTLTLYTFVHERHQPRQMLPHVMREGWMDESIYFPDKREPNVARVRRSPGISLDDHDRPQLADEDGPMGRERYNLRCGDQNIGCGEAVVIRQETLAPILDTLAEHAVPSVTLRALRARVRST